MKLISVIMHVYYVYFRGMINKTMVYLIFFQVYFKKQFTKLLIYNNKNIHGFAHVYVYFLNRIR